MSQPPHQQTNQMMEPKIEPGLPQTNSNNMFSQQVPNQQPSQMQPQIHQPFIQAQSTPQPIMQQPIIQQPIIQQQPSHQPIHQEQLQFNHQTIQPTQTQQPIQDNSIQATQSPANQETLLHRTAVISSPSIPAMNQRLQDLVNEVDPDEQLDEDVEEVLLDIADEFIENVVSSACAIAKHRNSPSLEVDDIKLYLERKYKIWIPGFGENKAPTKRFSSEAHKQRMALINKQDNRSSEDANKSKKL